MPLVSVDFGQKNWSSSILAGKSGFGRFWPKKVGFVDSDWKNWFLTEITGFRRFGPKKLVTVDSGSFWVIWGFLMSPELETEFSDFWI